MMIGLLKKGFVLFISPPFGNYFPKNNIKNVDNVDNKNGINIISIVGSFTLKKRDGLILQVLKTLRYSFENEGWINKIGLRNQGIDYAIDKYYNKKECIISIAIMKESEIPIFLNKIPEDMDLEVNISCPNTEKDMIVKNTEKFINEKRDWCILKCSPLTTHKQISKYYENGWRQFHFCNTIPTDKGGLSGKLLTPYVNELTEYTRKNYPDTTIICGGGITTVDDILNYSEKGGNHFAISTLIFNPIKFIKFMYDINKL